MKTKEDVTKFDNWIAGGRKKAAALKLYFLWIKSKTENSNNDINHLVEIVFFHFSFSGQLEEYLVPR